MLSRDVRTPKSAPGRPVARSPRGPILERRILEAALELAAQGGFEAVRQREVAERAGVALGTLYKRFRSKDELLIGVLEVESGKLASRLDREPPAGATPLERATSYFSVATHYLVRKPRLGRAVLRAVASGDKVSERMMAYQVHQMRHVVAALQGRPTAGAASPAREPLDDQEAIVVATILLQVWFAALVGWSGGLFGPESVVEQVTIAARLVLRGLRDGDTSAP